MSPWSLCIYVRTDGSGKLQSVSHCYSVYDTIILGCCVVVWWFIIVLRGFARHLP